MATPLESRKEMITGYRLKLGMMENRKIKSIERIEKKDGTVDFKLEIDDKLYILHNVEISQGNLEHNEDDSHSLSMNFTFDYFE